MALIGAKAKHRDGGDVTPARLDLDLPNGVDKNDSTEDGRRDETSTVGKKIGGNVPFEHDRIGTPSWQQPPAR